MEREKTKVFEVKTRVKDSGEYILGSSDTGSHACYLIYGAMQAREKGRELKPGEGHEEIFLAVKGSFSLSGNSTGTVLEGQAIHLNEEYSCHVENITDSEAVYVIAGGHSGEGHH